MKKHIIFLVALLLIVAMASPVWAGQKNKKASWEAGRYLFVCRSNHELAVKSLRAYRGLMMAAMRRSAIGCLPVKPDPGEDPKEDPPGDKKDPGASLK
jgi:hypothetical protein